MTDAATRGRTYQDCEVWKLLERHKIKVSNETVRKLMIQAGIWQTRAQRKPKVQQPRLRRPCFGELIQIDGSDHRWFEDRAKPCVTKRYLLEYGKPVAFYSDEHAVFRVNKAGGNSPAAKGRVERANGTLQDRLVKELRLAGIAVGTRRAGQCTCCTSVPYAL
jgi:hypothetical protein